MVSLGKAHCGCVSGLPFGRGRASPGEVQIGTHLHADGIRLDDEPQAELLNMLLRVSRRPHTPQSLSTAQHGTSYHTTLHLTNLNTTPHHATPHLAAPLPSPFRLSTQHARPTGLTDPPQAFVGRLPALQDLSAHHASSDHSIPESGAGTGEAFRDGMEGDEREREYGCGVAKCGVEGSRG